jgi:hypothetical protein
MRKMIAIWAWTLLVVFTARGQAQTTSKYCCEGYAFFSRRTSTPGTNVGGVGGDIFIYKGLAVGGDVGTTLGNPDNKITIGSADVSYHFACRNARLKVEPFIATGWSYLAGHIKTAIEYPFNPGQDRTGPNLSVGRCSVGEQPRLGVERRARCTGSHPQCAGATAA